MHPERLLLGPGPSVPYPEAVEALTRPVLGHLDLDYLSLVAETSTRLRTVFGTDNRVTVPVSGTGSAGMEACLASLVEPGDVVIVGVNGYFGLRLCEVARRLGAVVEPVEAPWGSPLPAAALLAAQRGLPHARLVAVVHAETSTGVRNDVAELAALQDTDTLLLLDCVTSLGGIEVRADEWGVDAAYSASQKCLGAPAGLSPVTLSERAMARVRARAGSVSSFYLDLGLLADYYLGAPPTYHHTASSVLVASLHAGLGRLLEEGLEQVWARHADVGTALQDGLEKLGFDVLAPLDHRLPQLTAARLPTGLDDATGRARLRTHYGIEVGGGLGPLAGQGWRFGLMGATATPRSVSTVLGVLQEMLG